jgi:hypothetical protein
MGAERKRIQEMLEGIQQAETEKEKEKEEKGNDSIHHRQVFLNLVCYTKIDRSF